MKMIGNARRVATRSHSMWANYLGILCLIAPEAIYWLTAHDTNPRIWWIAGIALIIYGIIGRLKAQDIDHTSRSPVLVAVIAMASIWGGPPPTPAGAQPVTQAEFLSEAVPLVGKWEGKTNRAFLDTIASPPRWTVCYGETRGVQRGDRYTDAECAEMLGEAILTFRSGLHKAFTEMTRQRRLTPKRDAAYVSLAYNAGIYAISRSTAVRRLNAGDIAGGCEAIGWWNRSGGRVVRGLVNRRKEDVAYCMAGL